MLSLTPAGQAAFAALDDKTRVAISALLDALPVVRRAPLIAAAETITRVFEPEASPEIVLRDLRPGDIGWVIHRQAVLYAQEYGWNGEYEALVARILADFHATFDPSGDDAWSADCDDHVVGSIFLVRGDDPGTGKLRLLYVEPETRGMGVGGTLIAACVERARDLGYQRLDLWTNSVLGAARRLYERAGFKLTEEAPHHSFGHDLIGQTWSLDLARA